MKRLFLLFLFAVAAIAVSAQDYTLYKAGITQIVDDTVASAGTDSRTVLLKIPDGHVWNYKLQIIYTQLSGTSEVYPIVSYSLDGSNWEAITAVAGDTLKSGNAVIMKEDSDGFPYRYLKVAYTAKTQTQSTRIRAWLYLLPHRY